MEYFGCFQGTVKTEWLSDGRTMKLLEDFSFIDCEGLTWLAPKGRSIDGASIPRFAWSIVGSPFSGRYRKASVIHDIACDDRVRPWESVHLAFYYAMRASKVALIKAKLMYAAVYHKGPRWMSPRSPQGSTSINSKIPEPSLNIQSDITKNYEISETIDRLASSQSIERIDGASMESLLREIQASEGKLSLGEIRNY